MNYRQVLTYTFHNGEARTSFEDLLDENGYGKADDQSTYVLPYSSSVRVTDMVNSIIDWSKEQEIHKEDFVEIFYLTTLKAGENSVTKIASRFLKYDSKTKGLK